MYDRRPGFFRTDDPPNGRQVEARVKWFNSAKGFGFVTPADGTQDAFLPMAILRRAGFDDVREGASITCEIGSGAKGPLVVTVMSIVNSTADAPTERRGLTMGRGSGAPRAPSALDDPRRGFVRGKGCPLLFPVGGGKGGL